MTIDPGRAKATPWRQLHPRFVCSAELVEQARRCVETSWRRSFRDGRLVELRVHLRSLPLLVQCAVRVHDRREGRALVLGLDLCGIHGRTERRAVIVARGQGCVLLFSSGGALDAAGLLREAPMEREIEWAARPHEHDWY